MKTDRQKLLNTFIRKVNGKGRSFGDEFCLYVPDSDHPGCAIGCQITDAKLRKRISKWERVDNDESVSVDQLVKDFPEVEKIVGNETEFLIALQGLHDFRDHWYGDRLKREYVDQFADSFGLKVPRSEYA